MYLVGLLGGDNLLLTHGSEDSDDHVGTVFDGILDLLGNLRLISGELDVLLGGGWREGRKKNETGAGNFRESMMNRHVQPSADMRETKPSWSTSTRVYS